MWPVFLQMQQSGEAVCLYKGGARQAGHAAAAAAADNSSHTVSQPGVGPVCLNRYEDNVTANRVLTVLVY